jgi:hypothetical protein
MKMHLPVCTLAMLFTQRCCNMIVQTVKLNRVFGVAAVASCSLKKQARAAAAGGRASCHWWLEFKETGGLHSGRRSRAPTRLIYINSLRPSVCL